MTEYIVEVVIDGVKAAGISSDRKPGSIVLKLIRTETSAPVVTVIGTKEIVVP